MDWGLYTENHAHASDPVVIEVVAYQRKAGGWDVFVHAPAGQIPELEHGRVDDQHIFVERVGSADEVDRVAADVHRRLGPDYERAVYLREQGSRRQLDRRHTHLLKRGAHHMCIVSDGDAWELRILRKHFSIADEVA